MYKCSTYFLGYVIAATGTTSYIDDDDKDDVPVEVFDLTNTSVTCKDLTNITARYGSTGGFVQNKILICGGWSYVQSPLYVLIALYTLTIWLTQFLCLEKIRINQKKFG